MSEKYGAFGFDIHEIHALSSIEEKIAWKFYEKRKEQEDYRVSLVLLLIMKPTSKIAKEIILPNLEYYHHRSGVNCDLYLVGYNKYIHEYAPSIYDHIEYNLDPRDERDIATIKKLDKINTVGEIDGCPVKFDPRNFTNAIYRFEEEINWKYSGLSDLIIVNAVHDSCWNTVSLAFSSSIVCNLDKMLEEKAIDSVEGFLEKIFHFTRTNASNDPTWGISDELGEKSVRSSLTRIVLSLLPKGIGDDLKRLRFFAVSDLTKCTG